MTSYFAYRLSSLQPLQEFGGEHELSIDEPFPEDVSGQIEWKEILEWLRNIDESTTADEIDERLAKLRNLEPPQLDCPRLFVSHRSIDAPLALALGRLALQAGFDVWIDVLDPSLAKIVKQPNSVQKAVATALIVEMALLNCSHLLAVMTKDTAGSWWVPYEYGRVKERKTAVSNAAAWLDRTFQFVIPGPTGPIANPEYLYLGKLLSQASELNRWLADELKAWRSLHHSANCQPQVWPYGETVSVN